MANDFSLMDQRQREANLHAVKVLQASLDQAARLEEYERQEKERKKREAENEQLAEQFRIKRQKELAAKAEADRKEQAQRLEAYLRKKFFDANPAATETDFRALLPELKKKHFLAKMEGEKSLTERFAAEMPRM